MKEVFTDWNPFKFKESREEALEFLSDTLLDEDPIMFLTAIEYAIELFGVAAISLYSGLDSESLNKITHEEYKPDLVTAHKLIQAIADLTEEYAESHPFEEEYEEELEFV